MAEKHNFDVFVFNRSGVLIYHRDDDVHDALQVSGFLSAMDTCIQAAFSSHMDSIEMRKKKISFRRCMGNRLIIALVSDIDAKKKRLTRRLDKISQAVEHVIELDKLPEYGDARLHAQLQCIMHH